MNRSHFPRPWNQHGATFPDTLAGKVTAGYLEALSSGDKDKLKAFIKAHRPDRPDALERMLDLRWNLGGFDLYAIARRSMGDDP